MVDSGSQRTPRCSARSPRAEGRVNVQPRSTFPREYSNIFEWIGRAGVDVSNLRTHDTGARVTSQDLCKTICAHAALCIGFHTPHSFSAEAQHTERREDRPMRFV